MIEQSGLSGNVRGSFAERDHLGRLVNYSSLGEKVITAPGDVHDTLPGDLPSVVPDWTSREPSEPPHPYPAEDN